MQNFHLSPCGGRWRLTAEGSNHILGDFTSRAEGAADSNVILRGRNGVLKICRADGSVEEERCYSPHEDNPVPPSKSGKVRV